MEQNLKSTTFKNMKRFLIQKKEDRGRRIWLEFSAFTNCDYLKKTDEVCNACPFMLYGSAGQGKRKVRQYACILT